MITERYRLNCPVKGACIADPNKRLVVIPEGAELLVIDHFDSDHLVEVDWQGDRIVIFRQDLLEGGVRIPN
jgi:hypothetical protein